MRKKEKDFKVGDWIYLNDSLNFDDHIVGGRAKIIAIDYKKQEIKLKGFPAYDFDLAYLTKEQNQLRKKYHWWNFARLQLNAGVDYL